MRGKSLKHNIPTSKGATMLRKYVRFKSTERILPSIHQIQEDIYNTLGLSDQLYIDEKKNYYSLLHRTYILIYMLHYHMPLQRRHLPGRRNTSKSRYSNRNKGWYSYLKSSEQELLQHSGVTISSSQIPEDSFNGISVASTIISSRVCNEDITNTKMLRNGNIDNITFQHSLLRFEQHRPLYHTRETDQAKIVLSMNPSLLTKEIINHKRTETLPTIQSLLNEIYSSPEKINETFKITTNKTWNIMFHEMCEQCNLGDLILQTTLPDCYKKSMSCGHTLHIEQDSNIKTTFQLTLLEHIGSSKVTSISTKYAIIFTQLVIKQNPIWDLGLQFLNVNQNPEKIYPDSIQANRNYTRKCICPCSDMFRNSQYYQNLKRLSNYASCAKTLFCSPMDFICHLQSSKDDYYHRIVMRIVQNSYSSLLAKFKLASEKLSPNVTFFERHKMEIALPSHSQTSAKYSTFDLIK